MISAWICLAIISVTFAFASAGTIYQVLPLAIIITLFFGGILHIRKLTRRISLALLHSRLPIPLDIGLGSILPDGSFDGRYNRLFSTDEFSREYNRPHMDRGHCFDNCLYLWQFGRASRSSIGKQKTKS